jgi:glycosyltransferase involved in cell wall biosynthesis
MLNLLREVRLGASCLPWRVASGIGAWSGEGPPVHFVIEKADWAIRWVGEHIYSEVEALMPGYIALATRPERLVRRIVHFGSQYMWLSWGRHMSANNQYVVSFFHGKRDDGPEVSSHIDEFLKSVPRLARIVTGASLIEQRLLDWGVPRDKVVRIPIGVDTGMFQPPSPEQKVMARARMGIPVNSFAVGSFQKDGVGWGDGMDPKLIKGPDLLLDTVKRLRGDMPLVVVLTGPARGYVKQGLERIGVPYVHRYVQSHADLVDCYHALDLYLVSSREEGGPMGLMESMASGVPVVATPVGMAPDLISDGITGGLADNCSSEEIARKARVIASLSSEDLKMLIQRARDAVMPTDWSVVGRDHWFKVYQPLLQQ